VDYPRNWHELLAWFPDEAACLRYLERLRWGAGFSCRFCGTIGARWWRMGDGLRRCAVCRAETSVTAGTIFAGTRLPLVTWFAAVWYVVNQKQGVSALGLQRVLGIGSYQTAWAWLHKLRRAMVRPDRGLLAGVVEVDETIIGGVRAGWRGRGHPEKALVAIAVEQRDRGLGRVRMQRIANASKETLTALRKQPGKDIWLFGGGDLFRSLLELNLVDAVEVAVIPVLLGGGIPLLPAPAQRTKLELIRQKVYAKTGTVSLEYAVRPSRRRRP